MHNTVVHEHRKSHTATDATARGISRDSTVSGIATSTNLFCWYEGEELLLRSFVIRVVVVEGHASFVGEEDVPLGPIDARCDLTQSRLIRADGSRTCKRIGPLPPSKVRVAWAWSLLRVR